MRLRKMRIGNGRPVGNVNGFFKKQTVHNPNDIAKRTIKETNIHDNKSGALSGPKNLPYMIKETNIHIIVQGH